MLHFGVTEHPTSEWVAQQMVEAFAERDAPRYLIRDRDASYGAEFRRRIQSLGMKEVITAARSPWQNGFVERLIGSIRRECLDHVVVLSERETPAKVAEELSDVLSRVEDASCFGEGRSGSTSDHEPRCDPCHFPSGWITPPL